MYMIAIDFEASCLPQHGRSYPIEVGISVDGLTSRSWLIRPHVSWADWTWTEEAERLHRLSQVRLWRDGLPVERVAAELAEALGGAQVIADNLIDAYWLETLYEAAAQPCPVEIQCIGEILRESGLKSDVIFAAQTRIDALGFGRHRAGEDARWLAALLMELEKQMQARDRSLLRATRPTELLAYANT